MPYGLRKLHFSFDAETLTHWGGLTLFQQFCKSLNLRYFLQHAVSWPAYTGRHYHPVDLFLAHLYASVAGIGRIESTKALVHNGLLPPLLGLPNFPHRDTLRTFLWRFTPGSLQSLKAAHDRLRGDLSPRLGLRYSAIVDADTTVLTVFGHPEAAEVGYNPKYRGKRSYAPIVSSEGRTGLSLGMELRAGDVHASTGAWSFLTEILDKLPSSVAATRTRVRLDGAFYDRDIARPLDRERLGYAIVARMTRPLRKRMVAARYHEFAHGWEAAEFPYTPFRWNEAHRFVAIRRPAALEPAEVQQRLFTSKRYTYHRVLVTNLELTPAAVWRFYCDRGFQELLLRELKGSYAMAKIPTRSFWANAAYMEIVLWAYDLVQAFQFLCLPADKRDWNISTLRRDLWWLPAEWVNRHNRNYLRLPQRYPAQELFFAIQRAASRVKPLV
jgi:hypothetical protein